MVYSTRWFVLCLNLCILFLCVFSPFSSLFSVLTCVFCPCVFSVHLALRLPRLGRRELILVLFVRLFDLRLFGFVCFLFLLVFGKACGLWLWHSLNFSLTNFLRSICTCTFLTTKQGTEMDSVDKKDEIFELSLQIALTLLFGDFRWCLHLPQFVINFSNLNY